MELVGWSLLAACIAVTSLAGLVIYHAVCGYFHYRYYVRRRLEADAWKIRPDRFLSPKLQRTAILTGSRNVALSGVLTGVLVYGVIDGGVKTAIYTDGSEYGWAYTLGMTVVLFVMLDCIAYWVHRGFHTKFLYRHVHRSHHRFVAPSPYVAIAIHPVEFLTLQIASLWPLLLIPFHAVSVAGVLLYILIFNIIDHSGIRLVSALPWQPPSMYHDVEQSDILGGTRQKYLCVDNYEEDYTFACTTPPADGTRWFTVCGKARTNHAAHMAAVGGLSLAGIAMFAMLCGATRRAATRGDKRDPNETDAARQTS